MVVQAAHIVPDVEPEGIAAVVNGLQGFHGAPIALPRRPDDRPILRASRRGSSRFEQAAA